jgi:hypothetical protein
MEVILSETVKVETTDGYVWTLHVLSPRVSKETLETFNVWTPRGHFGRLDQACERALDLHLFHPGMESLLVSKLAQMIRSAKDTIVESVLRVDPGALEAVTAQKRGNAKKRNLAQASLDSGKQCRQLGKLAKRKVGG